MGPSRWTQASLARGHALWREGVRARLIATILSNEFPQEAPFTKNMVLGKAHRLGWDSRMPCGWTATYTHRLTKDGRVVTIAEAMRK